MAKYARFDPRNKKRNKHKDRTKQGLDAPKVKRVGPRYDYEMQGHA